MKIYQVSSIPGVVELDSRQCEQINGGIAPVVWWLLAAIGASVIDYGVEKGLDYIFYS